MLFVTGSSGVLSLSLAKAVSPFVQAKEVKTQEERGKKEAVRIEICIVFTGNYACMLKFTSLK